MERLLRLALAPVLVGLGVSACASILNIDPNPPVEGESLPSGTGSSGAATPGLSDPLGGIDGLSFLPAEIVIAHEAAPGVDAGTTTGTSTSGGSVRLLASSQAGLCERLGGIVALTPDETLLSVAVDGDAFPVGSYDVGDQLLGVAFASFLDESKMCVGGTLTGPGDKGSGTVEVTSSDDGQVTGTIDLVFSNGRVRGAFTATTCSNPVENAVICPKF